MMKLILSLTLIWMLSSTDGTLQCYRTIDEQSNKVSNQEIRCELNEYCSATAQERYGFQSGPSGKYWINGCSSTCVLGSQTESMNSGSGNLFKMVHCCSKSLCNGQDLPYPYVPKENGLQCIACEDYDSPVCNKTVNCVGVQDRCFSGYHTDGPFTKNVFGCISRNLCEAVHPLGFKFDNGTECCEGSFCNSAWTVKLNVFFLLLGLILPIAC